MFKDYLKVIKESDVASNPEVHFARHIRNEYIGTFALWLGVLGVFATQPYLVITAAGLSLISTFLSAEGKLIWLGVTVLMIAFATAAYELISLALVSFGFQPLIFSDSPEHAVASAIIFFKLTLLLVFEIKGKDKLLAEATIEILKKDKDRTVV